MSTLLARQQLHALHTAFTQLQNGQCTPAALSTQARGATALLAALPPRYGPVLLQLLDRMEASALFTEESCSFSAADLHTHLQGWLAKAQAQLPPASSPHQIPSHIGL